MPCDASKQSTITPYPYQHNHTPLEHNERRALT